MGFWICWYILSLWVPNYTFQYRIHYHDATTSPPNPLTPYPLISVTLIYPINTQGCLPKLSTQALAARPCIHTLMWRSAVLLKLSSTIHNVPQPPIRIRTLGDWWIGAESQWWIWASDFGRVGRRFRKND